DDVAHPVRRHVRVVVAFPTGRAHADGDCAGARADGLAQTRRRREAVVGHSVAIVVDTVTYFGAVGEARAVLATDRAVVVVIARVARTGRALTRGTACDRVERRAHVPARHAVTRIVLLVVILVDVVVAVVIHVVASFERRALIALTHGAAALAHE